MEGFRVAGALADRREKRAAGPLQMDRGELLEGFPRSPPCDPLGQPLQPTAPLLRGEALSLHADSLPGPPLLSAEDVDRPREARITGGGPVECQGPGAIGRPVAGGPAPGLQPLEQEIEIA